MNVKLMLNGRPRMFDVNADESLLDTLRRHDVTSVKRGCDAASCGVCTVLVDSKPTLSCSVLTARLENKAITTVEGERNEVEKFYTYFGDEGADQCGFCNPALALTVISLKRTIKNPTDDAIRRYIVGNLCRCSGYVAQHRAIKRYLEDAV